VNTPFRKLLLASDGSEDAVLAAEAAADLVSRSGADLHVVHAWQEAPYYGYAASNAAYFAKQDARRPEATRSTSRPPGRTRRSCRRRTRGWATP
jgi:nucleotide-binding universal stress UspA family protein